MDPPRHDELRRVLRDTFTPQAIKALEPLIVSKVDELLDPIIERGRGDLASEFAHRLPFFVVCELFGIPREDHGLFEDWFVRMVVRDPGEMAVQDDVWVAGEEMRVYLDEAVRDFGGSATCTAPARSRSGRRLRICRTKLAAGDEFRARLGRHVVCDQDCRRDQQTGVGQTVQDQRGQH